MGVCARADLPADEPADDDEVAAAELEEPDTVMRALSWLPRYRLLKSCSTTWTCERTTLLAVVQKQRARQMSIIPTYRHSYFELEKTCKTTIGIDTMC